MVSKCCAQRMLCYTARNGCCAALHATDAALHCTQRMLCCTASNGCCAALQTTDGEMSHHAELAEGQMVGARNVQRNLLPY